MPPPSDLLRHRIAHQRLAGGGLRDATAVVAWFGAMQAQEFAMAKWAVGLRLPGATDATVQQAFDSGAILRTHVLRPTWHFVAPADIRWLLALTAPRIHAACAYMNRQLGLDRAIFKRSNAVLAKALAGGKPRTRAELAALLARAKLPTAGHALAHLLIHAELAGLICSGPRQGKQFTYALLDERVPPTKPLSRDEALAALTRRYFASRGPATAHDFAWWSGLTVTDARTGLATLGDDFVHETIAGRIYTRPATPSPDTSVPLPSFLMPDYDEYGMAYEDRTALFASPKFTGKHLEEGIAYNRMLIVEGRIIGSWRRTETARALVIELVPFAKITRAHRALLTAAVKRYAAFLGKPATITGI